MEKTQNQIQNENYKIDVKMQHKMLPISKIKFYDISTRK